VRNDLGSPPLAALLGQIIASQAVLNVLSAARYSTVVDEVRALFEGRWGTPPGPVDPNVRRAVVALLNDPDSQDEPPPQLSDLRKEAEGLASSEEELLLLGLFGEEAEPLLRGIRGRARGDDSLESSVEQARAARIREIVRVVQETGVGEITVEEEGMRVTIRRTTDLPPPTTVAVPNVGSDGDEALRRAPVAPPNGLIVVESPMVGVFYRGPEPGAAPFVEVGEMVAAGQTLCLLEAMKLFNELKADAPGIVRAIHVENAEPVEFGQLLFELEPVVVPLDAL
jgi:oxaloacetate decarboxylase (Na+ extruding) subunit alpha